MSEKRPTFSRKSRPRLDARERARLIAEFSGKTKDSYSQAFELPHIGEPATGFDPGERVGSGNEQAAPAEMHDHATRSEASPADPMPDPQDDPERERGGMPETPGSKSKASLASPPVSSRSTAPATEIGKEPASTAEPAPNPDEIWSQFGSIPVDPAHLERNLIITAGRHDPAHGAFDILRTRLVQTLYENDWRRVAITSPTRDCGKTFTSVNLAISLSRYETNRPVLMDMDMRNPSVANVLGATNPASMRDFLQGSVELETYFKRLGRNALNIGSNLAVGLNDRIEPYAAELLQNPDADAAFERMMEALAPDVVLYDLPPALAFDDVIAFKKHYDGVLMVIGGGTTTAEEVHEAMRRIGEDVPLLGVVLNQAEGETRSGYTYGY